MKVNRINSMPPIRPDTINFNARITIPRKLNMDNLYMYNDVVDIMKSCKVGGVVDNEGVKIDTPTDKITENVIKKLKELKIKFIDKK